MNVFQSFVIALEMLRQHKLRAFLTMLGVIIGVMSVTLIVMISNGFQAYINGQFEKAGADTIFVFFDPGRRGRGQTTGGKDKLTTDDMNYLLRRVGSVDMASALMNVPSQSVHFGTRDMPNPQIFASDSNFQTLNRFNVISGRSLSQDDVNRMASVCLIGEDVKARLFPSQDPVGKLVLLNGVALQVIGVIESQSFMGDSTGRMLLLPITTAQKKWLGGDKLDLILLRAKKGAKVPDAMEAVWEALMARTNNRAIYRVDSNESIMNIFGGIIGGAGVVLAGIAALSLLVGGIGIMNIMLVSVTERTKEIGLRKAIGARRGAILTQFLIEAATLSLVGGLIGMGFAWSLGQIVGIITAVKAWPNPGGLATPFPVTAAVAASIFSAAIGMVFGFYPAMTASRLDPIVALRTE